MSNKTASELLAESAVPFDEACMLVMAMENRIMRLERFLESINQVNESVGAFKAVRGAAKQLLTKEQGENHE